MDRWKDIPRQVGSFSLCLSLHRHIPELGLRRGDRIVDTMKGKSNARPISRDVMENLGNRSPVSRGRFPDSVREVSRRPLILNRQALRESIDVYLATPGILKERPKRWKNRMNWKEFFRQSVSLKVITVCYCLAGAALGIGLILSGQ